MRQYLTIFAAALTVGAFGQGAVLYVPVRTIADQGIKLKSWGSGTVSETGELAFEGGHSIRVSTRNFFQGGALEWSNPVDLSPAFADKNNLLRFVVRIADQKLTFTGGGPSAGGIGGLGGVGNSGGPAAGGKGGTGAGPGGSGPPGASVSAADTTLKTIRVIIATSDGKRSEAYIPLSTSTGGERGWKYVAVPLQAINGFNDTNKAVTGISLSGDAISTFYVGDVRIINDSTPITGDLEPREMNLALGDAVTFRARGFGGSSVLVYYWDFDDRDGVQYDAVGQTIKRKFRKAGKYTITLTIIDAFRLKKPYQTTAKVTVNP